ncbi:MAG: CopD family protein [Ignavibacteria bacterium]|nr:CopD family protein [Ignavibacteria bacterium]
MHKWLVILHSLGACVWIGGHLLLSLKYLPESLRLKNQEIILSFERKFEKIGIPALLIQLISGIGLMHLYHISWFDFSTQIASIISIKFILIIITILLAVHARFFIIPKLQPSNLKLLSFHIITVTIISIIMLFLGISVRFGL